MDYPKIKIRLKRELQAAPWFPGSFIDLVELRDVWVFNKARHEEDLQVFHPPREHRYYYDFSKIYWLKPTSFGAGWEIKEGDYIVFHQNSCVSLCKRANFNKRYIEIEE